MISSTVASFFIATIGCHERQISGLWSHFGPTALALTSVGTILLITASLIGIGGVAFAGTSPIASPGSPERRGPVALWLLTVFCVVLSAKLVLMHTYVVATPFWDQWGAEGLLVYRPFNDCTLSWQQMFALHNEHRVFFSRVLALLLLVVNGQWDPRLQQVVNAVIHAVTACVLVVTLWTANDRHRLDVFAFACASAFSLPFAWENTLLGFQSAFYLQLLFFVLAIGLTTLHRAGTMGWCLGWTCAACGLVTAAGGIFAPLALLVVGVLNYLDDESHRRSTLIGGIALAFMLAGGYWISSPPVPYHATLKAHDTTQFVAAVTRALAWPWVDQAWWSLVAWLPLMFSLGMIVSRGLRTTVFERIVVGLSVWVVIQAAAIAYGRGSGGPPPAPRYQDFLSLGFVANAGTLLLIFQQSSARTIRNLAKVVASLWLIVACVGMEHLSSDSLSALNDWHKYWLAHTTTVRRFVLTDDVAELTSKQPLEELPYPDVAVLTMLLQDKFIRSILPAAVRRPIPLRPVAITNGSFVPEGTFPTTPHDPLQHAWGSFSEVGNPAEGTFQSDLIPACREGGYLSFQLAGYIGLPQLRVATREARSGKEVEIKPDQLPREAWSPVLVPCPKRPFTVVAMDARPDYWFSFREPIEVGWASRASEALIAHGWDLLFIGLTLLLICAWSV